MTNIIDTVCLASSALILACFAGRIDSERPSLNSCSRLHRHGFCESGV